MPTNKSFTRVLVASTVMAVSAAMAAQSADTRLTLDQAVAKVQSDTGGKVLSAEPRDIGRRREYRIKVLTPDGHVRVVVVMAEPGKHPKVGDSAGYSPADRAGQKEKF